MCTVGYDDDGVKSQSWPLVREGMLVGLQTNRETAHYIGEKESRGCTFATSWRNYPFLRMPNVHVEPGPPGSPTPEEIIADTKDGVLIDGRGSYSIDQQRFNGQFGGDAFWEIKNGKKTRMVSDVTYNAITTDFWQNLDAIIGQGASWEMFGTTGDAKGQPVQINHPSHGSPWVPHPANHGRRGVLVGGATRLRRQGVGDHVDRKLRVVIPLKPLVPPVVVPLAAVVLVRVENAEPSACSMPRR